MNHKVCIEISLLSNKNLGNLFICVCFVFSVINYIHISVCTQFCTLRHLKHQGNVILTNLYFFSLVCL